jgi:signal peptidase I
MEPAFYRGDLIFLTNPANQRYQTGDIVVYDVPGNEVPIVHRILETRDVVSVSDEYVASFFRPENCVQCAIEIPKNQFFQGSCFSRRATITRWMTSNYITDSSGSNASISKGRFVGTYPYPLSLRDSSVIEPSRYIPYVGYATIAMVRLCESTVSHYLTDCVSQRTTFLRSNMHSLAYSECWHWFMDESSQTCTLSCQTQITYYNGGR